MTDTTNPNSGALQGFIDGVEEQLSDEEETVWIVFGPRWAQDKGADSPPEEIDDPVWAPSAGWMEREEAPLKSTSGLNEPIALYAPDSNDRLDVCT